MAVKILAVDDSATMRQIVEMTFAGEDAEVTTVATGAEAVDAARQMQPQVVLADASMDGMDGYAVAKAIKDNGSGAVVIVMSSQHHPYDEARGKESGVDDHIAKPFDSQVVIDKVNSLASKAPAAAASGPSTAQGAGPSAPTPGSARPGATPGRVSKRTMAFGTSPVAPPAPPKPPAPPAAPAAPPKRPVLELADEPEIEIDEPVKPPAKPAAPAQPPAAAKPPAPAKAAPPAAPAKPPAAAKPAAAASAATSTNGDLAKKLEGLGLDANQIDGVLALSREVIEQVVWEVVPDLAEILIKEEIARLTEE